MSADVCPVDDRGKMAATCYLGAEQERHDAYKDLQKSIRGITNMMLTKSSRELEAFGIVRREQFPEVPPRVSIR